MGAARSRRQPDEAASSSSSEPTVARKAALAQHSIRILCALAVIEGLDLQLLPASFRALEISFGLSPVNMAAMFVAQGLAIALSGPFWASLADSGCPRRYLLAGGSALWATCTLALACCWSYWLMLVLRFVNGVALGMLGPVGQVLIKEASSSTEIGENFGWIHLFERVFGEFTSMFVVTAISNMVIIHVAGWRLAFVVVSLVSYAISAYVFTTMDEPQRDWRGWSEVVSLRSELKKVSGYLEVGSFQVLVCQGLLSRVPALSIVTFGTLYFQYMGFPDFAAGAVMGLWILGSGVGSLFGGVLGDRLHAWSPGHGRPALAQTSLFLGIPFVVIIFALLERNYGVQILAGALCLCLGFVSSWVKAGCNQPVLCDVIDSNSLASAFAWDVCLERLSGSLFGPVTVSILAEYFYGYRSSVQAVDDMSELDRIANADALGNSIALCCTLPWALAVIIYGGLHFTYERDCFQRRRRERRETLEKATFRPRRA